MKTALIIRYGAYGDIIHMSFLPHLLKDQGYTTVDMETNPKGYQIMYNNPYIDNLTEIVPEFLFKDKGFMLIKHWEIMKDRYDKVVNLWHSIEYGMQTMESENLYYMSSKVRRDKFGAINFYDQSIIKAGYPELVGKYQGEFYPQPEEERIAKAYMRKFDGQFTVMMNLSGTGPHKRFVQAQELAQKILDTYPDAHIITTGAPECKRFEFAGQRITSIAGQFPFRQALILTKYVNCIIGCESGIMVAAGMWHTPSVQLMTAASIANHCKYNPNDYSLQSPVYCAPCHKGPYEYIGCPHKDGNPLCVYFDLDKIVAQVDKIYERTVITV